MSRRLVGLTLDTLDDLTPDCRRCVFWELPPSAVVPSAGPAAQEKAAWVSETLLEWGSCGQLVLVDGRPAGHALYAPAAYVPRAAAFATAPVAGDAVLLTAVRVRPEYAGAGLGRMLVQGVARDVLRRGIRAIEAFGRGPLPVGDGCLPPADFLRAVGFATVRHHPTTPRLRMDLRSAATWREDVESAVGSALERLLGPRHVPTPAG